MKNIKSILTLTLIGGSIILTGCSGNTEASAANSNNQPTTQTYSKILDYLLKTNPLKIKKIA